MGTILPSPGRFAVMARTGPGGHDDAMAQIATQHDAEHHRYIAVLDGVQIGELVYHDDAEGRIFTHSEIVPEHEHHGYGTQLVRAGLDDTRAAGIRPIGRCSMVRNFLAEHPDSTRLPSR
jgi:predicted GNAT family acetyltransferase